MNNPRNLLIAASAVALILLSWNIGGQDILGDEAAYSFRAVGYLDYLGTSSQTQPVDWYIDEPLPFWTKLSFHDHPPLGFLIPHLFFKVLGDTLLVAKLPSILAGSGSLFLIYLVAEKLFNNRRLAAIAALLASVNGLFIAVFRSSLLEPLLIFFILLNIYFFLRFLEDNRRWWQFGASFGLVILTKYTGAFLIPVYAAYLLLYRRSRLKDWRLYAAAMAAILLFSPVLIYNFYLYRETGHFDLQFAYLLSQETPEWQGLLGKEQAPFADAGKNLPAVFGWPFLMATLLGLAHAVHSSYKDYLLYKNYNFCKSYIFLCLYLLFVTLLLIKIGVASRFLALYLPAFLIFSAIAADWLWDFKKEAVWKYAFRALVLGLVIFEILFAYNKNFLQAENFGIAALDQYFIEEFRGKESAVIPQSDNKNLNEVIQKFAAKKSPGAQSEPLLIVYNDNMAIGTIEWIFYRRFFYQSIPTLFVENFLKTLELQGEDYFRGFTIYFVQSGKNTVLNPFKLDKAIGSEFENSLLDRGIFPQKIITGKGGLEMFRVYKFSL